MKRDLLMIFLLMCILSCQEKNLHSDEKGFVSLTIHYEEKFNPNISHGEIREYRVLIKNKTSNQSHEYSVAADQNELVLEDYPHGDVLDIQVEYLNQNQIVVRRGYAKDIEIQGGQYTTAVLDVYNVPIFANVKDGAVVVADRFVPQIFAPGEIEFEVLNIYQGQTKKLKDQSTQESSFSVSANESSLRYLSIDPLPYGKQELIVTSLQTGESSKIQIFVVKRRSNKPLLTTSGGYTGVLTGGEIHKSLHMVNYHRILIQ